MTIRVSLKAVGFVLYTVALLAGAFGISYAVFEWRDGEASDTSAIEQRLDELEGEISAGPTQAELDAQRCAAALDAAGQYGATEQGARWANTVGYPHEIQDALDRYCK